MGKVKMNITIEVDNKNIVHYMDITFNGHSRTIFVDYDEEVTLSEALQFLKEDLL